VWRWTKLSALDPGTGRGTPSSTDRGAPGPSSIVGEPRD
jgi:hypothetical protein